MSLPATAAFLYPRMFAIHDLPEKVGYAGPNGRLELPTYIRCSHGWMTADGAYILSELATSIEDKAPWLDR
jgi:protein transport protein SEC24